MRKHRGLAKFIAIIGSNCAMVGGGTALFGQCNEYAAHNSAIIGLIGFILVLIVIETLIS